MKRLIVLLFVSCGALAATTLYKSVDEQGNVTFSDAPPADGSEAEKVDVQDSGNVLPSGDLPQQMEQQQRADTKAAQQARSEQKDWQGRYDNARDELEQAEKTLESAKEIKEGDTVGSAFGGARPNQAWIDALEQAENDVETRREALKKLERERR